MAPALDAVGQLRLPLEPQNPAGFCEHFGQNLMLRRPGQHSQISPRTKYPFWARWRTGFVRSSHLWRTSWVQTPGMNVPWPKSTYYQFNPRFPFCTRPGVLWLWKFFWTLTALDVLCSISLYHRSDLQIMSFSGFSGFSPWLLASAAARCFFSLSKALRAFFSASLGSGTGARDSWRWPAKVNLKARKNPERLRKIRKDPKALLVSETNSGNQSSCKRPSCNLRSRSRRKNKRRDFVPSPFILVGAAQPEDSASRSNC